MANASENGAQDGELMRRIAHDDEQAVSHLYDRFGSLVYRMAHEVLSNRGEIDDVMQDVFVTLWRTAARYDPSRAALVTWVMLITRRRLLDRLRRHHRAGEERAGRAAPSNTPDAEVLSERREQFRHLMDRVAALPELQRLVLTRVYLRGHTLRQIGDTLRTPLGTIKTALNRGLTQLRAEACQAGDALAARAAPKRVKGRRRTRPADWRC